MANLIQLNTYSPQRTDRIFVDTNVWFWMTYAASNEMDMVERPVRYQTLKYPEFLEKVLDAGASLYHSPLTLAELSNVIERTEFDIYVEETDSNISRKEFRNIEECRSKVVSEIRLAWQLVCSTSTCVDVNLNLKLANDALSVFQDCTLDPYDSFYITIMENFGLNSILTDDKDFLTVEGVDVLTYRR